MPNLDRVNLCYDFLRANDTFTLSEFIQATSYSTSTAEKYLGSQLALYVQKNAGNYTILRNLPERDNFRKHFKQTSRIKNNEISILIDKSKNSALSAIAHYNSPYTQGKAVTYIPQMFIAITSAVIAILKKYKNNDLYEKDVNGIVVQVDGKNKIKYLIDLIKVYQNIPNIKLTSLETRTLASLVDVMRKIRNEIEHGSGLGYKLDLLLDSKCHALLLNYELLLNKELDESINNNLAFPLFVSEKLSEEQKSAAKSVQQKEYKIIKDIISTYNTTLDTDILSNNFYDFKIYAIPKSSSKERSSDVSVEYINIDELSEEQKKEIERNIIAVREKTFLEHLPQKFADAIKQKIEKVSSKKISSYIASYHLSTLMKKLGWKSNKEYRTTNKTYGRDYYTEKARVELFKKIDEDYESIVRLSNAHFVE